MRHRYAYATFPRAYSKSFLSVLILMIRCTLFPGSHLFVTTGGKEQAAGIAKEKVEELIREKLDDEGKENAHRGCPQRPRMSKLCSRYP